MLTSIYPAFNPDGSVKETPYDNGHLPSEIYDYYIYENKNTGEVLRDKETDDVLLRSEFNPRGYRVADEEVRSEGIELDLYYNPTPNLSLFFGYAYLETVVLESALDILEGLPTAGTSDHNLNLTAKYSFKQGKYKGVQFGVNQKYRSAALLNHYFVDLDGDNQSDYIARDVNDPKSGQPQTLKPRFNTLWLEDQHSTDLFVKWSGKLKKHHPWTVLQLNLNNVVNNRNLISTGLNNARYTEGRNIVLSAGFYF
jgi:outer membrane receptor protein involved in Fe transport